MTDNPTRITSELFEKIESLGAGASGDVWKVKSRTFLETLPVDDFFALKLYKKDILEEPHQRRRIAEEFKTGKTLVHPNLVKIYHVDIEDEHEPFLLMEWCEGEDLSKWRVRKEFVDEGFLLQFTTQMLDVLDFLHSSRRLHRDVKPTNINVDVKGVVRLLDYGIIRSLREPSFTQSGARFVGTYRYAAPEYIFQNRYDFTSDLYSLGAVIYFLLHQKEIFASVKRTPDLLKAKERHQIIFEDRLEQNGPIWKALLDLSKRLLDANPANRPASAMACLDLLARAVPSSVPYRGYFACALTRSVEDEKAKAEKVSGIIKSYADTNGCVVYFPGEHTHPQGAPDLQAHEVYWIDRERVASADLLIIFADDPSFGVGQEAEIAANAGVPIVLFHSSTAKISRMLKGIAGRITLVSFDDVEQLEQKAAAFFSENRNRLHLSRLSREREYHLRVGNRVREIREQLRLSVAELAQKVDVGEELIRSLETRPEQLTNISLVILRRLARALNVSPAELIRDQSTKDQEFEDLGRTGVINLREYAINHNLSYLDYSRLKAQGLNGLREQMMGVAAKGTPKPLEETDWRQFHHALIDETQRENGQ
jgi:serine/threonine protein kinase/transcriptional regulator with XRE-family HTH domain